MSAEVSCEEKLLTVWSERRGLRWKGGDDKIPSHETSFGSACDPARSTANVFRIRQEDVCERTRGKSHGHAQDGGQGNRARAIENLQMPVLRLLAPE
jgi:hypothetical protein